MATTSGKINGTDLLVYVNGTAIACALSSSIDMSTDTFETTCKDSAGWREIMPSKRSWSISGDGLTQFDVAYGFNDLVDLWRNRTLVTLTFKTSNIDDKVFTGSAYITSLSETAPMEDVTSYSFTFEGTDVLSYSVVA